MSPSRRVLLFRSCRPAEFAEVVRRLRARDPRTEITALTPARHRSTLPTVGVDTIVHVPGGRLRLACVMPWLVLQLRWERYDEVVVPQMAPDASSYRNLHRLAVAIAPATVTIIAGNEPPFARPLAAFKQSLRPSWGLASLILGAFARPRRQTRRTATNRRHPRRAA